MQFHYLKLPKLKNARDLGGIGTTNGRQIREGKLIRSGKLYKLPTKTLRAMKKLGITTVVDLRIENERCAGPDTIWEGCRYVHNPILCVPTFGIAQEYHLFVATERESTRVKREGARIRKEFGSIDNYMIQTYRSIVFDNDSKKALSDFFRLVIEEDGCILWHCASGKDRAGICAMLIEALLGVNEETIYADYMESGKYWRNKYRLLRLGIFIIPANHDLKRMLYAFMRIKEVYLKTVIEEMKEKYGGITEYCKQELNITDEDIQTLREKYLV